MAHNARSEHGCPVLLPRARRVLRPQPLKHVHASPSRGGGRRLVVPGARGVLGPQPPQNLEMSARCRLGGRLSAPRTPRLLRAQPLKHFEVPSPRRHRTSLLIPRAPRLLRPQPLEDVQVPSMRRSGTSFHAPRGGGLLRAEPLEHVEVAIARCSSAGLADIAEWARRSEWSQQFSAAQILEHMQMPASRRLRAGVPISDPLQVGLQVKEELNHVEVPPPSRQLDAKGWVKVLLLGALVEHELDQLQAAAL
mmetsp:Transcript_8860/g.30453  ORF Transcript_8860/g.30453 Transcript_8860/m.30453 type:complete len:251 (-) Transcript_8860:391-1143(-)